MKIKKSSTMLGTCQMAFDFVSELYRRPVVLSLSRYGKGGVRELGSVAYAAWLEWASPLASRGGELDGAWLSNYQAKFGGQSTLWGGK